MLLICDSKPHKEVQDDLEERQRQAEEADQEYKGPRIVDLRSPEGREAWSRLLGV